MHKLVSSNIDRKYRLLKALRSLSKPTMLDLMTKCDLSNPTVTRHLADLRSDYGMTIKYKTSTTGAGYYLVLDYGWIDIDKMDLHLSSKIKL